MSLETHPVDARGSFAWVAHPDELMQRASCAIAVDGGCLVVDPVDHPDLDARLAPLGPVVGVATLLNRHQRDAAAVAARHGAPRVSPAPLGIGEPLAVPGIEPIPIPALPGWREAALWIPERRLLVCAEAVGTNPYYLAPGDRRLGVHPFLRLRPPRRALAGLDPATIVVGHGAPVQQASGALLAETLAASRRRMPGAFARLARLAVRGMR